MLDMDGTILDLAYDNYMWMTHVPEHYAVKNGLSLSEARKQLFARFGALQGDLSWYCLDHWSERLDLDVLQLHRDNQHRIEFLPGAQDFLGVMRERNIEVLLVTNSHPDTLKLKDDVTGFSKYFAGIYCSHSYGFAKERQEFWSVLHYEIGFDPNSTMFVDDSQLVLKHSACYGVDKPVAITCQNTPEPPRQYTEVAAVEGVSELL